MTLPPFKVDAYSEAREGYSVWLRLDCTSCASTVAQYQKDGPGPLLRCYFDRFRSPGSLADLSRIAAHSYLGVAPQTWTCPQCHAVLGETFAYRDGRLAFALQAEAVKLWQLLDHGSAIPYVAPEPGVKP